ncbi:carboxyltransferase domain-containing protein [Streptomyces sp. DG2A-72]|uniref:carboxyltransferase domain-containing protein n=1 Tax=Streptomyces sp. DG2A-72 TaxID=3051386 RepID=UPI00265C0972|nr:carboxyltransferase domain-containing protein [Streptomyces sp. DG2A-72]MDO0935441.1 carboxyltransferase domain-containing protein [Streptomyces sp. DG2A-72]
MTAIIHSRAADTDRPAITYRAAGDRYVLVEYGEMALDLELNFFVTAVSARLAAHPVPGLVEGAPGFRSLLVQYEPAAIDRKDLIAALEEVHDAQESVRSLTIPSRLITLPIAFADAESREAVRRYATTIRQDAPNVRDNSNIDYIVEYNGLDGPEALYETVTGTEWWNAYTGFFPGLPFMFPLDPRNAITVPKYNPTRTWTAEGAVGIGGPCVAIYPVESPGGYQLFGRTVPVYDILARHDVFREDPLLIRPGDRVRFLRVSEDQLLAARRDVLENRYEYMIEDDPFSVADYLERAEAVRAEADTLRTAREAAAARMEVP